jgi:mitogen-activated protein kinase kinase kinase
MVDGMVDGDEAMGVVGGGSRRGGGGKVSSSSNNIVVGNSVVGNRRGPARVSWRLGGELGRGSFGAVYRALDTNSGLLFAAKRVTVMVPAGRKGSGLSHSRSRGGVSQPLPPPLAKQVASLEREIALMKHAKHEHVVQYFGTDRHSSSSSSSNNNGDEDDEDGSVKLSVFIFMEFVAGGSLATMLGQFGKFNEKLTRHYLRQILAGVAYLHSNGIIHRDIKGT